MISTHNKLPIYVLKIPLKRFPRPSLATCLMHPKPVALLVVLCAYTCSTSLTPHSEVEKDRKSVV